MPYAIAALLKKQTAATNTIKDPVYYIDMDSQPVIKASVLGALMGTNVAPTVGAPVTANMAMKPAFAAATNHSSIAKTTFMCSSTSQPKTKPMTASGISTALTSPKASLAIASHPMVNLAFVKKAISDVLKKEKQDKI